MTYIVLGISIFAYALLLFIFPASFFNDDSLFFSNGINHFSVIDLSPHFPGYVSIVLLGKMINIFVEDSKLSLYYLSSFCGIFLPFVIYLYLKEILNARVALITFLLCLFSTYTLSISLSMLSESIGLFFLFLSLYFMQIKQYKIMGILLAISFFARPSYFILFIVGLIYLSYFKKEILKEVLGFFLLTSSLLLLYVFACNGWLYIIEGERFLNGHFNIWGTGQNASHTWLNNIFRYENSMYLLLILCFFNPKKELLLLYMFFISYSIWIFYGQNPENFRHLIPLFLLANIFLSVILEKRILLLVLVLCFNTYVLFSFSKILSPLDQIIQKIDKNNIFITNRGVEILREKGYKVIDKFYKGQSDFYKDKDGYVLISTNKKEFKKPVEFKGRFIGERSYYLEFK